MAVVREELADEIVAGIAAALGDEPPEVADDGRELGLAFLLGLATLGAAHAHEAVAVLIGNAEQVRDHGHGKPNREVAHRFDVPRVDRVEQLVDATLDPGVEVVVEAASHRPLDEGAPLGVPWGVVVYKDDDAAGIVDARLPRGREHAGVAQDVEDVGVPRHDPCPEVGLVVGRAAPQQAPVAGVRVDSRVGGEGTGRHGAPPKTRMAGSVPPDPGPYRVYRRHVHS